MDGTPTLKKKRDIPILTDLTRTDVILIHLYCIYLAGQFRLHLNPAEIDIMYYFSDKQLLLGPNLEFRTECPVIIEYIYIVEM